MKFILALILMLAAVPAASAEPEGLLARDSPDDCDHIGIVMAPHLPAWEQEWPEHRLLARSENARLLMRCWQPLDRDLDEINCTVHITHINGSLWVQPDRAFWLTPDPDPEHAFYLDGAYKIALDHGFRLHTAEVPYHWQGDSLVGEGVDNNGGGPIRFTGIPDFNPRRSSRTGT